MIDFYPYRDRYRTYHRLAGAGRVSGSIYDPVALRLPTRTRA